MNFDERNYTAIVRDLLTVLTQGTAAETHVLGETVDVVHLEKRPVRRVSHLQGKILLGEKLVDYVFNERDFELVGSEQNPQEFIAVRFRPKGTKPAPRTTLTVNYYPERLPPTPLTDTNVGSVVRTLLETVSREMAMQYHQLQRVYDSAFVETATGTGLDRVAALVDTRRLAQGHPVGKVRFSRRSGSPGSIFIPISTPVSDGAGKRYLTSHEATLLPNQATVEVWIQGQTPRTEPVVENKLTVLERAIAGIDRVTNDEPTYRSTEEETDDQLRARARRAIHATGKGTPDALRYGLEGLSFVSAITLSEYPDPTVLVPGTLRVDVALSEDNAINRSIVDQRIEELRPAGIYIERQWAGKITLGFRVDLILAGSSLSGPALGEVKNGVAQRLSAYVKDLAPGETLRRSRLLSRVLEDDRVVDATIQFTADGTAIEGDTWELPIGKSAALDSTTGVTFGEIRFEEVGGAQQPVIVQVDADLTVTNLTVSSTALETSQKSLLESFFGSLEAGSQVTFDQLATAIRDDAKFALVRSQTVFAFDQEGGGFTELRDNDPPFGVPSASTVRVRAVRVKEPA